MKIYEILGESKQRKKEVTVPATRNFVAKNAPKSGAGSHTTKKFTRKEKHKSKEKN